MTNGNFQTYFRPFSDPSQTIFTNLVVGAAAAGVVGAGGVSATGFGSSGFFSAGFGVEALELC